MALIGNVFLKSFQEIFSGLNNHQNHQESYESNSIPKISKSDYEGLLAQADKIKRTVEMMNPKFGYQPPSDSCKKLYEPAEEYSDIGKKSLNSTGTNQKKNQSFIKYSTPKDSEHFE